MPKKERAGITERILAVLDMATDGVRVIDLESQLKGLAARRTIQRRLDILIAAGQVRAAGEGPARRFFSRHPQTTMVESGIRYGIAAEAALTQVRRPERLREPVSFDASILTNYTPNESRLLPKAVRDRMFKRGVVDGERLAGTYARQIFDRLLIDLSWASSHLEGNTYDLLQTARLINEGVVAEGKSAQETQMILNHKRAIEFLLEEAGNLRPDSLTLRNLHAILADNLLPDPDDAGRLRTRQVWISGSVYEPLAVPQRINEHFLELSSKASAIRDPYEQSFFCLTMLPYLQPFIDVNKRVARLATNIPLIRDNHCPITFIDVPFDEYVQSLLAVYELRDFDPMIDLFDWAQSRSVKRYLAVSQSLGEPDRFRMKYGNDIFSVVAELVRHPEMDPVEFAYQVVHDHSVAGDAKSDIAAHAINELERINEGNFARYGLRKSEFDAWQRYKEKR